MLKYKLEVYRSWHIGGKFWLQWMYTRNGTEIIQIVTSLSIPLIQTPYQAL